MLIVNCRDLKSFFGFCLVCCFILIKSFIFIFMFFFGSSPTFPSLKPKFPCPHISHLPNYSSLISHAQTHQSHPILLGCQLASHIPSLALTSNSHATTRANLTHLWLASCIASLLTLASSQFTNTYSLLSLTRTPLPRPAPHDVHNHLPSP